MEDLGLFWKRSDGALLDRWQDRLMIPIRLVPATDRIRRARSDGSVTPEVQSPRPALPVLYFVQQW